MNIPSEDLHSLTKQLIEFFVKSLPVAALIMIASAVKARLQYSHLSWWKQAIIALTSFTVGMCVYNISGNDPRWSIGASLVWDKTINVVVQLIQDKIVVRKIKEALLSWISWLKK